MVGSPRLWYENCRELKARSPLKPFVRNRRRSGVTKSHSDLSIESPGPTSLFEVRPGRIEWRTVKNEGLEADA